MKFTSTLSLCGLIALAVTGCANINNPFGSSKPVTIDSFEPLQDKSLVQDQAPILRSLVNSGIHGTAAVLARFGEPSRMLQGATKDEVYYDYAGVLFDVSSSGIPVLVKNGDFYPGSYHVIFHFKNAHLLGYELAQFKPNA